MAEDSGNDNMMLDIENVPVSDLLATIEGINPNPPTPICGDSIPEPQNPVLNGFADSRPDSSQESSIIQKAKLSNLPLSPRNSPALGEEQPALASPEQIQNFESELYSDLVVPEPSGNHGLPVASLPTGLCYDMRMRYHCETEPTPQRVEIHPEDPRRIYEIYRALCLAGLVEDTMSKIPIVHNPLHRIFARLATQAEICLVHDLNHFIAVAETKGLYFIISSRLYHRSGKC